MPLLLKILKWIAAGLGVAFSSVIGEMSSKYAFRALAVTAMAGAFMVAFQIMYTTVQTVLQQAVGIAQSSQASMGITLDFALCIIPSTLPEAITVMFSVMLQAVAVRWTRQVLFAKLA